jgi:cytochrome c oxidase cbb3-type subunit 1
LRVHFRCSALGIAVIFIALTAAGLVQGFKLNHPAVPIVDAIKATVPFLGVATLGWLLLLAGQVVLAINLGWLVLRLCAPVWRSVLALLKSAGPSEAEVRA